MIDHRPGASLADRFLPPSASLHRVGPGRPDGTVGQPA
jgi:hypothetical protein